MNKYMSGQQAINKGLISEDNLQQALKYPWAWVIVSDTLRIREIPWQGLEVETIS